jgi:hypothetical protein
MKGEKIGAENMNFNEQRQLLQQNNLLDQIEEG